jgi:hypothetical protein
MVYGSNRIPIIAGLALALLGVLLAAAVRATPITMADRPTAAPSRVPGAKTSRPRALRTPGPVALPVDVRVPHYEQGVAPFRDGETLVYDASWEGIAAAQARMVIVRNRAHPAWWTGQMWIATSSLADRLYRMRDYFREDFSFQSWLPSDIRILQHEKARRDQWHATFDQPRELITAVKINKQGRTWIRRFSGAPWGPFSGAMMALSQPLKVGQIYTFDVFSGGNRYVFAFNVVRRERITTGLGTFNSLRIEPSVVWLSEGGFRSQATAMTIWVTDDQKHLPIRIEAAVYIGSVRADLTQASQLPVLVAKKSYPAPAPSRSPTAVSGPQTTSPLRSTTALLATPISIPR